MQVFSNFLSNQASPTPGARFMACLLAIQTENNICVKKKQPIKTKHVSRFSPKREHGRSDGSAVGA